MEALDVDVGPPEAAGLVVVLFRYRVAEADAGAAVQAPVRLLVDPALAVGVGGDQPRGEEVRFDGLCLLGECRAELAGEDAGRR